jgi:hypothetical protein
MYVDGSHFKETGTLPKELSLKNGDTIQGTVVSVSEGEDGKTATISVGDSVINAKLSEEMGLREGQTLNFAVRSASGSTVSITPLFENTSPDQSTLKALMAAGIEINNDTVTMVKDMMSASLPIDKDSLLEMNRNLTAFPNTSISTLVEMKSLNIPITENNIAQYTSYKNYEHQVINEMQNIMDELPATFNELVQNGDEKAAMDLYGAVLKLFSEGAGEEANAVLTSETPVNSEVIGETAKNTEAAGSEIKEQEAVATNKEAAPEMGKDGIKDVLSNSQDPKYTYKAEGFDDTLRNLGVSEKTIAKFMESATKEGVTLKDSSALLKELSTLYENSSMSAPVEAAAWKKLFSDDTYNKLLKDNIESQWLLKPDDVQKKENIENLYQRLGNQAKALSEAINNTVGTEGKLPQAANNLSNNLDFMNQINQMFQYVQLPLQMTGQNAHGDLYVYQNKHKKLSEDGSVSAILHLDMENLGPVDVYVKMKDTNVSTRFYVADDSVIELINDNIHILNERLEKRGYTMSVKTCLHSDTDSEDPAIDEMLNVTKTPILSTASFDARA